MKSINRKRARLMAVVAGATLLSGCSLDSILSRPDTAAPQVATAEPQAKRQQSEGESCPSCGPTHAAIPSSDCAKAVAVVNYADRCQSCGRFPVSVRAYGQANNCK